MVLPIVIVGMMEASVIRTAGSADPVLTGTPDVALDQLAVWHAHGVRYALLAKREFSAAEPSNRFGLLWAVAKIVRRLRSL